MSWTPNTIKLISRGRYDEAVTGADCHPGMLLADSGTTVIPHNVAGGAGPLIVLLEDALQGGDITQKVATGKIGFLQRPAKGDVMLMLIQNGQTITNNQRLMSAGDGTLIAALSSGLPLYEIVAPSTNVTNTVTETTFSNGSYVIAANTLAAGDVLHIRGKAVVSAQNSTNTHKFKVYVGSTALFDSTALALAAAEYVEWDMYLTVRSIGATGKIVVDGFYNEVVGGTPATGPITLASTTLDTTATATITVKSTASAASTGNVAALQEFQIDLQRAGGTNALFEAAEACDNSLGTGTSNFSSAKFCRCLVI